MPLNNAENVFVDGIGIASSTSGVLTQAQGRIFALLYLRPRPLSLDEIASELQQSKSNVSVNIRALLDWRLVRRVTVSGSRRDHYEAATDFWRVMQEILERRFRWNLLQVLTTVDATRRTGDESAVDPSATESDAKFVAERLDALSNFARAVEGGMGGFAQGRTWEPDAVREVANATPITSARSKKASRGEA